MWDFNNFVKFEMTVPIDNVTRFNQVPLETERWPSG